MLVTGVGDEMCWRQLGDVVDGCWRWNVLATTLRCWWRVWPFCHQHSLSRIDYPLINVERQQPKVVTNIEILSLTFKNSHRDKVTTIQLSQDLCSPTSKPYNIYGPYYIGYMIWPISHQKCLCTYNVFERVFSCAESDSRCNLIMRPFYLDYK